MTVFSPVSIVTKFEASRFLLVTNYYSGDKIKKDWIGGACGTNGREEKEITISVGKYEKTRRHNIRGTSKPQPIHKLRTASGVTFGDFGVLGYYVA